MIRENKLAARADARRTPPAASGCSAASASRSPSPPQPTAKSRDRRSDLIVAALGVTLGLICALFPWYIFFNPEEFGVRAHEIRRQRRREPGRSCSAPQPERVGAPVASRKSRR